MPVPKCELQPNPSQISVVRAKKDSPEISTLEQISTQNISSLPAGSYVGCFNGCLKQFLRNNAPPGGPDRAPDCRLAPILQGPAPFSAEALQSLQQPQKQTP